MRRAFILPVAGFIFLLAITQAAPKNASQRNFNALQRNLKIEHHCKRPKFSI
jgi:hypothetical protein